MDKDIVLEKDAISLLEASLRANSNAGAASAQIRFLDDPEKIQYNGCHIHYVGEAIQNASGSEEPAVVGAVSAGTVLVDRAKAVKIGLFDEDFFFGWEDGDFTFRMTLAGYPCLVVPAAKVFHNTEKKVIRRVYYQVRNRWWFILKTYNLRTLVVVLPAILLYQVGALCFLTWKGYFVDFVRGTCAAFGNLRMVAEKRKEVMKHKRLRDRDVLRGRGFNLILDVEGSKLTNRAYTLLDKVFSAYWFFAKRWIA
jgi:GT2 family glycosyltransferase